MTIPKTFIAVYECVECGSEYELWNCYVPYTTFYCEDCCTTRPFVSRKMVHKSWEWDRIED